MGRTARGVRGISLREADHVVAMTPASGGTFVLTVCENGYGKRTPLPSYPTKNRGGLGLITIKTTARNGKVIGLLVVDEEDHVVLVTSQGKMVRLRARSISVVGRNTQGVRLVSMDSEEKVVAFAKVAEREVGAESAVDAVETADPSEVAAAAAADADDPDTDPRAEPLGEPDDEGEGGEIGDTGDLGDTGDHGDTGDGGDTSGGGGGGGGGGGHGDGDGN
jgi:DNA gyrase subunit A